MPTHMLAFIYDFLGKLPIIAALFGGVLAVDYSNTISLGTTIIAILGVIIAGAFTIRARMSSTWHDESDAQTKRADRLERELNEEKLSKAKFETEQAELRHNLKTEIATRDLQIKALESKTDLTIAMNAIKNISEAQAMGTQEIKNLLTEIRDRLPILEDIQ